MAVPANDVVAEREAIVNGDVVKPLYFSVVDVALPLVPPLQTDPVPHVDVATSVPKAEYPNEAPLLTLHVLGAPV